MVAICAFIALFFLPPPSPTHDQPTNFSHRFRSQQTAPHLSRCEVITFFPLILPLGESFQRKKRCHSQHGASSNWNSKISSDELLILLFFPPKVALFRIPIRCKDKEMCGKETTTKKKYPRRGKRRKVFAALKAQKERTMPEMAVVTSIFPPKKGAKLGGEKNLFKKV